MKRFIVRLILFIAPVLIICIATELLLRNIPNDYRYKRAYLDKNADKIETLVLGSSHFYYGVDPQYFHQTGFNAAYASQTLNYDLAILEKYADQWKNLKCIVLPVDYFSLCSTLEEGLESWRVKDYRIYYGIDISKRFVYPSEIVNTRVNIIFKRLKEYYIQKKPAITSTASGWGTGNSFKNKQNLDLSGVEAAKRHTVKKGTLVDPGYLEPILAFAKSKGIKVYIITSPAYKTYYNNLDSTQLNNTINAVNTLAIKYPNVVYVNLLRSSDFAADDFYDADHLNEFGAKKLSQKIDSIISGN